MKILICSTRMVVGGAETHVLSLAKALTLSGHHITVLSSGGVYAEKLTIAGIDHRILPLDKKDPLSVLRCRKAIYNIAVGEKFDIVHAHGRIPAFVCGTLRRKTAFPPLVVTAHGLYDPAPPRVRLSVWGDRVIAVSEDVKKYLTETYRLSEQNITVIPNGVDTDVPAHVPSKSLRILTASRLDKDTVLTALLLCEMMPRIRRDFPELAPTLTVAGGGKMLPLVRETARRINAESPGAVTVAGEVTDMPAMLARADVFVGSSRAALEAMAATLPVVLCSDVGCAGVLDEKNILRCEQTNFTCRGEEETSDEVLRGAMERVLCASEGERVALGRFGRAYVVTRSSSALVCHRTEKLFRSIIDEKRPGIMLCGYFGCKNAGDDATLDSVLGELKTIAPDVTPTIPAKKKSDLPAGVRRIGKYSVFRLCRELKKTRLFILCGGSLIQNSTSDRSLWYYSSLCSMAERYGAKIIILGGGIGPLFGNKAWFRACKMVEKAQNVSLRDPDSVTLAEKAGADISGILLSADAALNTQPIPLFPRNTEEDTSGNGNCEGIPVKELPKNRYYAVSVRPLRGLREYSTAGEKMIFDGICDAVGRISEKYELIPLWIPFAPEDEAVIKKLSRRLPKGRVMPLMQPGEIVTVLSSCVFSMGLRMHMAVFSSCAGIPAVCISYDPKVSAFAGYAGHPDAVSTSEIESYHVLSKNITSQVDILLCVLTHAGERVSDRTEELRRLISSDMENLGKIYRMDGTPARS